MTTFTVETGSVVVHNSAFQFGAGIGNAGSFVFNQDVRQVLLRPNQKVNFSVGALPSTDNFEIISGASLVLPIKYVSGNYVSVGGASAGSCWIITMW